MSPPQILSSQIYSYKSLRMMRGNDEMARCKDSFRLSFQHIYTPICSFAVSYRDNCLTLLHSNCITWPYIRI